jgi:zinc-binding in reverse transcriptase
LISLSAVWNKSNIKLQLTRNNSLAMCQEKPHLLTILNSLSFTLNENSVVWVWISTGIYTIRSLYNFLFWASLFNCLSLFGLLRFLFKHKLFLWIIFNNKILTRDNLCKKGWIRDSSCVFYMGQEMMDHLFFHYPIISDF